MYLILYRCEVQGIFNQFKISKIMREVTVTLKLYSFEELSERARIREEERERKRLLDHQENVSKWLNGESHVLHSRIDHRDYLRLSGDKVETSQGIKMSIQEARVLQSIIKADRLKVDDKVLDYTVIEVSDRVRIGCHTFPKEYLINFKLD